MALDYLHQKLPTTPAAIETELNVLGALDWELVQIERLPIGNYGTFKKTTV